jgi:hypothetical protein
MKKLILTSLLASALVINVSAQWVPGTGIITTTNKVGIGTNTPFNRFSVKGATASMDFGEIGDQGAISFNTSGSAMILPNFALSGNQTRTVINVPSATGSILFQVGSSNKMALSSNGDLTINGAITSISNDPKVIYSTARTDGTQLGTFSTDGWGNFSFSKSLIISNNNPRIFFGDVSNAAGTLTDANCALRGTQVETVLNSPSATGQISFKINNVTKLNLTSSGNVGIGNTTPTNPLSVKGAGAGTVELGQVLDQAATPALVNGAIGFNTGVALTRKNSALWGNQTGTVINAPTTAGNIFFRVDDATKCTLNSNGLAVENGIIAKGDILIGNKAGTWWVPFATRNIAGTEAKFDLSNINSITVSGTATFGNTLSSTGLYGTATAGKNITFGTGANAANAKMTILESGNVGIGTTITNNPLTVKGAGTGTVEIGQVLDMAGNNTLAGIGFCTGVAVTRKNVAIFGSQLGTVINTPSTGMIKFNVDDATKMTITKEGVVGIGCVPIATSPYLLEVKGIIHATEVKVEYADKFPDFVFEKDYKLRSLAEVNSYISEQGHLPEIPSAAEVKANGVNMMEMQAKLLQKVEELTLYAIQQQQLAAKQQQEINELKAKLENK